MRKRIAGPFGVAGFFEQMEGNGLTRAKALKQSPFLILHLLKKASPAP